MPPTSPFPRALLAIAIVAVLLLAFFLMRSGGGEGDGVSQEEQVAVLTPPSTDATPEAVAAYETQVKSLAQHSSTLSIGANCAMDPLVLEFKAGEELNIVNTDSMEHTVSFEDQNFFNVAPGVTRPLNITETFTKGAGIYRYRCNDLSLSTNVGVMSIVE